VLGQNCYSEGIVDQYRLFVVLKGFTLSRNCLVVLMRLSNTTA